MLGGCAARIAPMHPMLRNAVIGIVGLIIGFIAYIALTMAFPHKETTPAAMQPVEVPA